MPMKDVPHSLRNARHQNPFPATLGGAHYDDYQWSYEVRISACRSRLSRPLPAWLGCPRRERQGRLKSPRFLDGDLEWIYLRRELHTRRRTHLFVRDLLRDKRCAFHPHLAL